MADKKLVAKLTLDNKSFKSKLSDTEKDILKFSGAVAGVGAAILAVTKVSANFQDQMVKSARAAGLASDSFSGYAHAADLSGVSNEQLIKSFTKLNNITPAMAADLNKFGVAVNDSTGKLKSSETLMSEIADRMLELKSPADQAALAVAAFGEKGAGMVNLLSGGSQALRDAAIEAEKFGLIVSEKAGQNAEEFNDDISRVGMSIKGLSATISESIIEFANQSGVIKAVSESISKLTGFWKDLDDGTKEFIMIMGTATVAAALLAGGIVAIQAVLVPMLLAISPIIIGIGLAVAAFVALAAAGIKYADDIKGVIIPAIDFVSQAFDPLVNTLSDAYNWFVDIFSSAGDTTEEFSLMGTAAKVLAGVISVAVVSIVGAFEATANFIGNTVEGVINAGKAIFNFFTGDFTNGVLAGEKAYQNFAQATSGTAEIVKNTGRTINDIFSQNYKVKIKSDDIDDTNEKLKETDDKLSDLDRSTSSFTPIIHSLTKSFSDVSESMKQIKEDGSGVEQALAAIGRATAGVMGVLDQFAKQAVSISRYIANSIMRDAQLVINRIDKELMDLTESYDLAVEQFKESEKAKNQALEDAYDAQIAAIKQQEEIKNGIIKAAAAERLLLLDEEYQAAKQKKEEEYQAYLESEQIKYEAEKALILQRTLDKEQQQLVDATMDEDFKAYLEQLELDHQAEMNSFAAEYSADQKAINANMNSSITANTQTSNDQVTAIEQDKATAVTEANENMETTLAEMMKAYNDEQERLQKERVQVQYDAELAAYESTKGALIAQTLISGIAAAAAGFAALAPIPVVGIGLGIALAATIMTATGFAIADIEASAPPPPPQLLAEGGWVGGNTSHAQGGLSAEIESDEFVIDKVRTNQIYDAIDNNLIGNSGGLTINFGENSIVGTDIDSEEAATKMAELLAVLLRREGIMV